MKSIRTAFVFVAFVTAGCGGAIASPEPSATQSATAGPTPLATPPATPAAKVPLGGGLMLVTSATPDPDTGTYDLYTLDVGTGEQRLLGTLSRRSRGFFDLQWGTDRKHVLITNSSGLVTLESPTQAARDLTIIDCCEKVPTDGVSLSPQGDRIAAQYQGSFAVPGCPPCGDAPASVVIADVDGSGKRTIALPDGTLGGGSPSWSPDGSAVVVVGCRPCNNALAYASAANERLDRNWAKAKPTAIQHGHVFIVPVDGSPVRELFDAAETTFGLPKWSPDGTTIAFPRYECAAGEHAPYCEPATAQLVTMTVADGQPTVIADQAGDLAWSPDGRRLTFGTPSGLFVIDADGSHLTKVAEGQAREPTWSPDGAWLVFADEGLWIVAADGGEPRPLKPYGAWAW